MFTGSSWQEINASHRILYIDTATHSEGGIDWDSLTIFTPVEEKRENQFLIHSMTYTYEKMARNMGGRIKYRQVDFFPVKGQVLYQF